MEGIDAIDFIVPQEETSIIKVIGVGGGGGNAINHMFREGINDVTFVICNTDNQALVKSPIKKKIQLGPAITAGLGAGNNPEVARQAAEESLPEIEAILKNNTKMVFITAGMGGGTGTGAAPVIAKAAKDLGILTVGIVTIPFAFEGTKKIAQALEGVQKMNDNVDALLVINNERLCDIYPELELANAFAKADDVLKDAAKGIAEIITIHGHINVDFADVNTIMRGGGVAIMNTGFAFGENRLTRAIDNALNSPLLRNNDIRGAKKVLMNFYCSRKHSIKVEEISQINAFMDSIGDAVDEVIWGICFDDDLEEDVKITLIATGFAVEDITPNMRPKVVARPLNEPEAKPVNIAPTIDLSFDSVESIDSPTEMTMETIDTIDSVQPHAFIQPELEVQRPNPSKPDEPNPELFEKYYGDTQKQQQRKAESFSSMSQQLGDEKVVEQLESVPAYKRRQTGGPQPYRPKNLI